MVNRSKDGLKLLEAQEQRYHRGAKAGAAKRALKRKNSTTSPSQKRPTPRSKLTAEEVLAKRVLRAHPGVHRGASRLEDARLFPRIGSGVFFLVSVHEVVYVGSGLEIGKRVFEASKGKDFDEVQFYPLPRGLMREIETAYIRVLRPKYNKRSLTEPEATVRDIDFTSRRVGRKISG